MFIGRSSPPDHPVHAQKLIALATNLLVSCTNRQCRMIW
jgi:hypothetical protein